MGMICERGRSFRLVSLKVLEILTILLAFGEVTGIISSSSIYLPRNKTIHSNNIRLGLQTLEGLPEKHIAR